MTNGVIEEMGKTKFIAFDSSTKKTGVSYFVDGKYVSHTLINHEKIKDVNERTKLMVRDIYQILDKARPQIVVVEHPQGSGSNVDMVYKLGRITGAIYGWCINNNCNYEEFTPSEWRKLVGMEQGKKTRPELKQLSIQMVKDKYGIDVTDDEADSINLGQAVVNYYKEIS